MRALVPQAVLALLAIVACSSGSGDKSSASPDASAGADGGTAAESGSPGDGASVVVDAQPVTSGLGPAQFGPGDLDPPSNGGTITFEQIGATGWYPSIRDPAKGPCTVDTDAGGSCCLDQYTITSNALTPWSEELIMTLRGPMVVKQLAVYQPSSAQSGTDWSLVSAWDDRTPGQTSGVAYEGDATPKAPFAGGVGSECLVNVSTAQAFPCGAGSVPYCTSSSSNHDYGWAGAKLFVVLAKMPHAGASGTPASCSTTTTGNWYDASWIGLSVGELVRAGAFSSCQCYAKDPAKGYLADGCGQFNVFEVVNDNNQYKNLDVFSTDMIDYAGYVGQGPCGSACNVATLPAAADLIDKANDTEAAVGAVATPAGGPGAALRRPEAGYRYFLIALDVASRTVQLALVHPMNVPKAIGALLPDLPGTIPSTTVGAVLALRLPH
jgi:hypothetical protein